MNKIFKYEIKVENISFTCGYVGQFDLGAEARGGDAWMFNDDSISRHLTMMIVHDHSINCSTCHLETSDAEIQDFFNRDIEPK